MSSTNMNTEDIENQPLEDRQLSTADSPNTLKSEPITLNSSSSYCSEWGSPVLEPKESLDNKSEITDKLDLVGYFFYSLFGCDHIAERSQLFVFGGCLLITSFVVQIASIVIGSLFLHNECPIESCIPSLLIAGGLLGVLLIFYQRLNCVGQSNKEFNCRYRILFKIQYIILILMDCIWTIFTSDLIYLSWGTVKFEVEEHKPNIYCNKQLYLFTFGYVIFKWIFLAISCVLLQIKSRPIDE